MKAALSFTFWFVSGLVPSALAFQWPPITGGSRYTEPHGNADSVPSGGSYGGPGDTTSGGSGSGAGGAGGHAAPKPATPSSGGAGGASGTGPGAGTNGLAPTNMPNTPTLTMTSDDSWYLWWEFNKAEFLRPNRLDLFSAPASGDDALLALQRFTESLRTTLGGTLVEAMRDGDPRLRAAAAIAYGRTSGAAAIPRLCEMLGDANVDVRHGAILGLGATGAEDAAELLFAIAKHGSLSGAGREHISPTAEAHAIVALGLGRAHGAFPSTIDTRLAVRVGERGKAERESIGCAAMLYQRLAPCPEFEALAFQIAGDESEAPIVRCRAIEALGRARSEKTLAKLQALLAGPRLDVRRSAGLALGELADPRALAPLLLAYEQESETLTRGFLLTAIGRRGGERARELLLRALVVNPKGMHPWSALALGILGRKSADPELAKALRDALEKESNQQSRGAYWIAAGLIGDLESLPLLAKALGEAADPRSRMYAASALALLGGEEAHRVLRARIAVDTSPLVRAAIAQSLGCLGRGEDLDAIAATLDGSSEPELQAMSATALGFHASYDALRRLSGVVLRKEGAGARRAAAMESIGMLLGRQAPLALTDLARESNYTLFNEWIDGLYRTTL